ncbi:MAG: diguanylate cyclase [Proteobacteria bacterium]|nr:diguanylate cyclase [Pseudomonadota bacterium]
MFLTGVLQSFGMVFLSGSFYIIVRFVSNAYDIKPILFTVISLITTSMILTLASGPGKYAVESLKSKDSWKYAVTLIISYVIDIYLVKYVSGTEAGVFMRMTIPISFLMAFVFFRRIPSFMDLLGVITVIISMFILFNMQKSEDLYMVVFLVLMVGISRSLMYITSESHKQSDIANREGAFRDKIRVVAFVSFLASMIFLILSVGMSILKTYYLPEDISKYISFIPNLGNFVNMPTIVIGLIVGTFIAPVNRYLKWSATYKIKAENVLAILAFESVFTLLFEWMLSFAPSFQSNLYIFKGERGAVLLFVVVLSTIGASLPVFIKVAQKCFRNKGADSLSFKEQLSEACTFDTTGCNIHAADDNSQDYEIVLAAVAHCQKNLKRAAKLLELPKETVKIIYDGQGEYCLNDEHSLLINKNFREKVVLSDPLTGLANRTAMLASLEKLYNQDKEFSLVFIDLNKFKQINDTYGHDAGDMALIEVGSILKHFLDGVCLGARFAGDEFCLILPFSPENSIKVLEELKKELNKTVQLETNEFDIKASLGMANSQDYKTASLLLSAADELMYKEKQKSR